MKPYYLTLQFIEKKKCFYPIIKKKALPQSQPQETPLNALPSGVCAGWIVNNSFA